MTWFKVDDGFGEHPKVDALGSDTPVALTVWLLCGCGSARARTDGRVTTVALARHCAILKEKDRLRGAAALVRVGLWELAPDKDGWIFHHWDDHQPLRADLERAAEQGKRRKDMWKERKDAERLERKRNAVPLTVPNGVGTDAPTRPDPTRPETESKACVISEAEQPAAPEARTGESARAHAPGGTTYVTGQQTLADTFRAAVEERYRAANLPAPKVCRDPYDAVWVELARWLHEAHKLRGWSHSKPDMAREMVRAFYASTDPRTVAAKHNIKYLAARPEEYLGLKVPT